MDGTYGTMSVRRVRRRDAMRCHAVPCRAMQMMRHERPACSLVRLPPPVRCRRPGIRRTPTAATTVTVHVRGDSPRQTIYYYLHTTSRYHQAGCNRSNGLSPRPRGQLSEAPVILTFLSLSLLSWQDDQDAVKETKDGDQDTIQNPACQSGQALQPPRLALHFTGGRCMAGTYLGTSCFAVRHSSRAIGRGMILAGTNRWKGPAVVCATVLPPQRYALM